MSDDDQPVIATVSGKDLLDKLDDLSSSFNSMATKLDNVPRRVDALEEWRHEQEQAHYVTWPHIAGAMTLLIVAAGTVAAFLALR